MAKTAKLKKNAKCTLYTFVDSLLIADILIATSLHSRAAKRASSPSLNLDKSITSLPTPSTKRPSILAVSNGAGITKRKGKGKRLTRHQRLRHEKGTERAETVLDKREKKVERSVGKEKVMKERNVSLRVGSGH